MADLIKKIKIKKQDGTFTDYIPIGAEAQNISTNDGDSVQLKLNKKPYYYNSVADMKADTNLKVGDMAITLGYYEPNDGGGAEYYIVNSNNNYGEDLNNNLFAELNVFENINIKSIGAYGDGVHDDTVVIQNIINKIKNNVISSNSIEEIKTIVFPGGKYKITSTINVSPYVKIKTSGFTTFLSYVTNGSCLYLAHQSGDQISSPSGNKQDWYRGDWINGEAGLLIKNVSGNNVITSGIEIGSRTNLGSALPTSRYIISNVRIQGFNIGILHNTYNNYLGTFFRVSVEGNTRNIQYGTSKTAVINSGEKMTYIDCLFASGEYGLYWFCDGMDSYFTNCSFDFLQQVFYIGYGYSQIVVNGCHIEGTSNSVINNHIDVQYAKVSIINSSVLSTLAPICKTSTPIDITFENNKLLYGNTDNMYDLTFMFSGDSVIKAFNNTRTHGKRGNMISKKTNLIVNDDFSDLETGPITITGFKLGNRTVEYNPSLLTSFEVCEDNNFEGKYLKITSPGGDNDNYAFHITTDFIPVISNKTLVINNVGYNESGFGNHIIFYDSNKEKIDEQDIYHYIPSETQQITNTWVTPPYVATVFIPAGVSFVKIKYFCSFKKNQEYGCIGRLMAEYE